MQGQRQFDQRFAGGGGRKRPFDGPERGGPAKRPAGASDTVFKLLIPAKRVGSLIGKGGSIVRQMREETGARITIADAPQNTDERMVVIQAADVVADIQFGPAQLALFRVHNRLLEAIAQEAEKTGVVPDGGRVTTRLLIADTQAGSVIGRKGDIIKQIRDTSKAFIKVLTQEENPSVAASEDRVVQIIGEPAQVQLALEIVSKQLRENPPKGQAASWNPPSTAPQPQVFIPSQTFNPAPAPLSVATAYRIDPATGALVPIPAQPSSPPQVRFKEIGREQGGARVFAQDQFGRLPMEPESLRGDSLLGEYDPHRRDPAYHNRRDGLLPREELSSGGRDVYLAGDFENDRGGRMGDYISRPQADFRSQGGDRDPRGESVLDWNSGRASPPFARGANANGNGVSRPAALGGAAGILGGGSLGGAVPGIGNTVITAKITIARSMVGPVIGRKGANVQQIRQLSGASIKVHDQNVKGDERIVEIEGSPEAVASAQNLVQTIILQAEQEARNGDRLPPGYNTQPVQPQMGHFSNGDRNGGRAPGFGSRHGMQQRR